MPLINALGEIHAMTQTTGSCLCGKVTYSFEGAPVVTAVCHCRDCQKQTGTSFSIIQGVPRQALAVMGTPRIVPTQGMSGGTVHRHFCGDCGSPLYSLVDDVPALAFLKAGTLDDVSTLAPQLQVWCSSAQSWLALDPALPRFDRNPPRA
jgi:hypothetical protein